MPASSPRRGGGNAFLRRIYTKVECWQQTFLLAAGGRGGPGPGGLWSVQSGPGVRELLLGRGPGLFAQGLLLGRRGHGLGRTGGLLQKPQDLDDEAIAWITRQEAPELARQAYTAVERRLAGQAAALSAQLCRDGLSLVLAEALEDDLRHLGINCGGEPPCCDRQEACQALAVVLCLRQWLNSSDDLP